MDPRLRIVKESTRTKYPELESLGEGTFGRVYKSQYIRSDGTPVDVAVKILKPTRQNTGQTDGIVQEGPSITAIREIAVCL